MCGTDKWIILIVDDNKDIHKVTENALFDEVIQGKELEFISAYSDKEAIDIIKEKAEKIAVIFLDMVMDMEKNEGMNVIKYLRDIQKNNKTHVILRTGYSGREQVKIIIKNYQKVEILEKGDTDVDKLIEIVDSAITKYLENGKYE